MTKEDKLSRGALKEYFKTGDRPTESEFGQFIDATINQTSDAVFVDKTFVGLGTDAVEGVRLTVGGDTHVKDASLTVDGNANVGGNATIAGGLTVTGETTLNGQINVNNTVVPSGPLNVEGNITMDVGENPTVYTGNGTGLPHRFLQLTSSPEDASPSGLRTGGLVVSGSHSYGTAGRNDLVVQGSVGIGAPTIDPSYKFQLYDGYMALLKGPQNVAPSLFIQNGNEGLGLSGDRIYKSGNQRLTIQSDDDIILWSPSGGRFGFGVFQPSRDVEFAGQVLFQGDIEARSAKVAVATIPNADNDLTPKKYVDDQVSTLSQSVSNTYATQTSLTTEVNSLNTKINNINTDLSTNYASITSIRERVPVGVIVMWNGSVPPPTWGLCDGTNGRPDLRSRFVVSYDTRHADYDAIGPSNQGAERVTLTKAQMPVHNHTTQDHDHDWNDPGHSHPRGDYNLLLKSDGYNTAKEKDDRHPSHPLEPNILDAGIIGHNYTGITFNGEKVIVDNEGGGESHENRPPFYVLAFIIKLAD
ncbi:MAG: hypothetical protein AAFQ98_08405 [Bacteroidota bacterium]